VKFAQGVYKTSR